MNSADRLYCVLDYETFSEAPIKKVGGYEYSLHKSTEILCAGFRIGTRKTLPKEKSRLWFPDTPSDSFSDLLEALLDPRIYLVAQNALFEILITKHVFARLMRSKPYLKEIPLSRWICTASMSRSVGLPGKLEEMAKALELPHQKDMEGHRLMLRLSKPKKPSKKDPSTRIKDPALIRRLGEYCLVDVDVETEALLVLPDLIPKERELWLLDQRMNLRGFAVDRKLVNGALSLIDAETKRLDRRVSILTNGELSSARQRDAVLKFLRRKGIKLPNLKAGTVKEYLAENK